MLYKDAADDILINLSLLSSDPAWSAGAQAVAVDTQADYAEVDLGLLPLIDATISLPYTSGWALALRAVKPTPCEALDVAAPFGVVNEDDLLAFLDPANTLGQEAFDEPEDVFDFFDVIAFLRAFDAGCP